MVTSHVALLLQHVTHAIMQCDITFLVECQNVRSTVITRELPHAGFK